MYIDTKIIIKLKIKPRININFFIEMPSFFFNIYNEKYHTFYKKVVEIYQLYVFFYIFIIYLTYFLIGIMELVIT